MLRLGSGSLWNWNRNCSVTDIFRFDWYIATCMNDEESIDNMRSDDVTSPGNNVLADMNRRSQIRSTRTCCCCTGCYFRDSTGT